MLVARERHGGPASPSPPSSGQVRGAERLAQRRAGSVGAIAGRRPGGAALLAAQRGGPRRRPPARALLQAERVADEVGQARRAPRSGGSQRLTMSQRSREHRGVGVPAADSEARQLGLGARRCDSTARSLPLRLATSSARSARSSSSAAVSGSCQRAMPTEAVSAGPGSPSARAAATAAWKRAAAAIGLVLGQPGQHHHELVAAEAADAVVGAELLGELRGDLLAGSGRPPGGRAGR